MPAGDYERGDTVARFEIGQTVRVVPNVGSTYEVGGVDGSCHEARCATCGEAVPDGTCPDCCTTAQAMAQEHAEIDALAAVEQAARGFIGDDRDLADWNAAAAHGSVSTVPGTVSLVPENIAAILGGPVRLATRATVVAEFMAYLRANGAHIAEYTGGGIEARVSSQIEGFALTELIEGFTRP